MNTENMNQVEDPFANDDVIFNERIEDADRHTEKSKKLLITGVVAIVTGALLKSFSLDIETHTILNPQLLGEGAMYIGSGSLLICLNEIANSMIAVESAVKRHKQIIKDNKTQK